MSIYVVYFYILCVFYVISEVPVSQPSIHGIKNRYKIGEIVRANCTSKYSKPAANLTWTINDNIVSFNINYFLKICI